jgi:hypothetical protein
MMNMDMYVGLSVFLGCGLAFAIMYFLLKQKTVKLLNLDRKKDFEKIQGLEKQLIAASQASEKVRQLEQEHKTKKKGHTLFYH